VQAYLSKVTDSSSADGSSGWFKIFADTWAKNPSGASGDDDFWGTKDINTCCGRLDVKIPTDIAPGDYLFRAEALALHTAASTGNAQFYMTCYQLTITGSGSAAPGTVSLPGAYAASDPGILVNIHAAMATYIAPGPTVYSGGSTRSAGAACAGCESTCTAGKGTTGTATSITLPTSTGGSGGSGGCSAALYAQCGGLDYTGCTTCTVSSPITFVYERIGRC
jgi:cellulase